MPTAEERERLIDSAVGVSHAYDAYQAAMEENYLIEQIALEWPVADIMRCATEARRRLGLNHRTEDEMLSALEELDSGIRHRYSLERMGELEAMNANYESSGAFAWDTPPNGV